MSFLNLILISCFHVIADMNTLWKCPLFCYFISLDQVIKKCFSFSFIEHIQVLCQPGSKVEVLSGTEDYSLKCEVDSEPSEVLAYNWIFNGSFVHPSLNPGLSVLTNGDLHFEKILPSHFGTVILLVQYCFISSNSFSRYLQLPCEDEGRNPAIW